MSIHWKNTFVFSLRLLQGGRTNGTQNSLNMKTNISQYFRNINKIKLRHHTLFSSKSISQLTTTLRFLSCNYVIPITNTIFKKSKPTVHSHSYRYCVYFTCVIYISHIAKNRTLSQILRQQLIYKPRQLPRDSLKFVHPVVIINKDTAENRLSKLKGFNVNTFGYNVFCRNSVLSDESLFRPKQVTKLPVHIRVY